MLNQILIDYSSVETFIGFGIISVLLAYAICRRFHFLLAISFLYFTFINLPRILFPRFIWKDIELSSVVALQSCVMEAELFLIFIVLFFILTPNIKNLSKFFLSLAVIDALVMAAKIVLYRNYPERDLTHTPFFIFANSAFDCAFISCLIPFAIEHRNKRLIVPLFVLVCFMTKTSTGVLGVGLAFTFYYFAKAESFKLSVLGGSFSIAAAIGGYLMQGKILLFDSGRFNLWKLVYTEWLDNVNHWVGAGTGTYTVWGPTIQIADVLNHGAKSGDILVQFPTLHNEWFQILFESGLIGLFLCALIYVIALIKVRKNAALFSSICVFGATAFIQMHLRWFFFGFFGAWLLSCAYGKKNPKYNQI